MRYKKCIKCRNHYPECSSKIMREILCNKEYCKNGGSNFDPIRDSDYKQILRRKEEEFKEEIRQKNKKKFM